MFLLESIAFTVCGSSDVDTPSTEDPVGSNPSASAAFVASPTHHSRRSSAGMAESSSSERRAPVHGCQASETSSPAAPSKRSSGSMKKSLSARSPRHEAVKAGASGSLPRRRGTPLPRAEQVLVGGGDHVVDLQPLGSQGEDPGRVARVDEHLCPDRTGCTRQRGEILGGAAVGAHVTGCDHRDRAIDRVGEGRKRGGHSAPASRAATTRGRASEANSPSGIRTTDRSSSVAPTSATATDTAGINATLTGSTPIIGATSRRQASPAGSHASSYAMVPDHHPAAASTKASKVAVGGSPYVAVSR